MKIGKHSIVAVAAVLSVQSPAAAADADRRFATVAIHNETTACNFLIGGYSYADGTEWIDEPTSYILKTESGGGAIRIETDAYENDAQYGVACDGEENVQLILKFGDDVSSGAVSIAIESEDSTLVDCSKKSATGPANNRHYRFEIHKCS